MWTASLPSRAKVADFNDRYTLKGILNESDHFFIFHSLQKCCATNPQAKNLTLPSGRNCCLRFKKKHLSHPTRANNLYPRNSTKGALETKRQSIWLKSRCLYHWHAHPYAGQVPHSFLLLTPRLPILLDHTRLLGIYHWHYSPDLLPWCASTRQFEQ